MTRTKAEEKLAKIHKLVAQLNQAAKEQGSHLQFSRPRLMGTLADLPVDLNGTMYDTFFNLFAEAVRE